MTSVKSTKEIGHSSKMNILHLLSSGEFNGPLSDLMMYVLNEERYYGELGLKKPLVSPYSPDLIREEKGKKVISYGQSSFGYDIRCSSKFKIFSNINTSLSDPKNITGDMFVEKESDDPIIIPPNSYALTHSIEEFNLPRDITGICFGKSTYARCGIIVNVTPLEAGWSGYLTIEISNSSPLPAVVYPNEGIAQVLFFKSVPCVISYSDRGGKYNNQPKEIVTAKL